MNNSILLIAIFALGVAFGLIIAFALRLTQAKSSEKLAKEILRESEERRQREEKLLLATVQNNFGKMSLAVANKANENFLQMAEQRLKTQTVQNAAELNNKKALIDQQLNGMVFELSKVTSLVKEFEADRIKKFGELRQELTSLGQTSSLLQKALADSRSRGQWGERMAEDILRLAGFVENVNYRKQVVLEGSRPDYTFILPKNLVLNMDVKFPLDNYMKYLNSEAETDRDKCRKDFLRDVRNHITTITKRDYINTQQSTVDCVVMFIPNEQIYRFIHEEDDKIIDDALSKKVILCSPLTLFIVLAVIRQAAENFALETSSREILLLLGDFKKRWEHFIVKMDDVDKSLTKATDGYHELLGKRSSDLEKPLKRIDGLMKKHGVSDDTIPTLVEEVASPIDEALLTEQ
ncbi:MAG: DNA recombination protein RmuC [Chloroflexi bacterium]|nr:DNA recombination protein RmuC [Chloroflexota bacterium]